MSELDLDVIEARGDRKIAFGGLTSEPAFGTDDDARDVLALVARVRELEATIERVTVVLGAKSWGAAIPGLRSANHNGAGDVIAVQDVRSALAGDRS